MPLRRPMLLMLAMLSASGLTACSASRPSGRVDLPVLDARLAQPCARPVALPGETLTADQVAKAWVRDRASLARCGDEKAAIVGGYQRLRTELAAPK